MNIMCLSKHRKRRSIGKKCFLHIENSKILRFAVEKGANCETPFPVFAKKCQKTAISSLIRLAFEAN